MFRILLSRASFAPRVLQSSTRSLATGQTDYVISFADDMKKAIAVYDKRTEIDIPALKEHRASTLTALQKGDAQAFLTVVSNLISDLKELPVENPFHLKKSAAFYDHQSPLQPLLNALASKTFHKSLTAAKVLGPVVDNNHSGFAIAGPRGTGKTDTLRFVNSIMPMLLPNVIAIYVDCFTYKRTQPVELVREAIEKAQLDNVIHGYQTANLDTLIHKLQQQRRSIMFMGDELGSIYTDTEIWSQLHTLATSKSCSVFVADSSIRLRALIKADRAIVRALDFKHVQDSLNDSKLKLTRLMPLVTAEELQAYVDLSYPQLIPKTDSDGDKKVKLQGLYIKTAGRLREIVWVAQGMSEAPHDPRTPFELAVLEVMADQQDKLRDFDVFNMAIISETELVHFIKKYLDEHANRINDVPSWDPSVLLIKLQDDSIIRQVLINDHSFYTFARPRDYFAAKKHKPKLFVSHACANEKAPFYQELMKRLKQDISVVHSDSAEGQAEIAKGGLTYYMDLHFQLVTANAERLFLVVLTPEYLARLQDPTSGCSYEIKKLAQAVAKAQDPLRSSQIIFAKKNLTHEAILDAAKLHSDLQTLFSESKGAIDLDEVLSFTSLEMAVLGTTFQKLGLDESSPSFLLREGMPSSSV